MVESTRIAVTLIVFAAMLVLVVVRPRRWSEAWWTMLGAAAMLGLRLVSPRQAMDGALAGKNALLFLLALLTLSLLVGKSGFFDWAAIRCARFAKGDAHALYRNSFVLGAVVTAVLSLDTTAVMLTPVLLAVAKRLRLPAAPYVMLCALVANVGSLALPISNLTNILFADTFHLTFTAFAAKMMAPELAALGVTFGLLRWRYRRELPERFDMASLPEPNSVVPNGAYFRVSLGVLIVVLVGYFLAPPAGLEPWTIAFAGSAVLAVAGVMTGRVGPRALGEVSWDLFPFVIGLFVAVQGLENLGIVDAASQWLGTMGPGSAVQLLAISGATALASNIVNNLPAALIARSVLAASHVPIATTLAALIGADVGPLIMPFGSLATMLVLTLARREGEEVRGGTFVLFGLWATPIVVVLTTLALALIYPVA